MASTRLTNTVRDAIWHRLEEHAFKERRETLGRDLEILAQDMYAKLILTVNGWHGAASLPIGWICRKQCFRVKVEPHGVVEMNLRETEIFPVEHAERWSSPVVGVLSASDPLSKRYSELQDLKRTIEGECKKAKSEAFTILSKATTFANLKKSWPELLPLCADLLEDKPVEKFPLVVSGSLNKNLGLPAEGAKK